MCLIVFNFDPGSDTPLLLAANRDEFYRRRSLPLAWWPENSILAGRDLGYVSWFAYCKQMLGLSKPGEFGTWLGVSRSGRFAAITNFRGASDIAAAKENKHARSRGLLVSRFLASTLDPAAYAAELSDSAHEYNGFNLLFGSRDELWYLSNRTGKPAQKLMSGLYGLSNATLDTPWYKLTRTTAKLAQLLPEASTSALFDMMAHAESAPDADVQQTGLDFKLEKALSPAFIRLPGYGTRVTSVIALKSYGHVRFTERTFRRGKWDADREVDFVVAP